jgi:hypothetical protein
MEAQTLKGPCLDYITVTISAPRSSSQTPDSAPFWGRTRLSEATVRSWGLCLWRENGHSTGWFQNVYNIVRASRLSACLLTEKRTTDVRGHIYASRFSRPVQLSRWRERRHLRGFLHQFRDRATLFYFCCVSQSLYWVKSSMQRSSKRRG